MKTLLLYITLFISTVSFGKEYYVVYTTSDDQTIIKPAIVKIQPIKGDTINIRLTRDDGLELVNVSGVLGSDDYIKLIGDEHIEGGYIYKHAGRLRGNIFINVGNKKTLFIIIREK